MSIAIRRDGTSTILRETPDSDGDQFFISDVPGLDGALVEFTMSDGFADGGFVSQGRLVKRELTIKGIASAGGSGDYGTERVRRKIENMFAEVSWRDTKWLYIDLPSPGIPVQLKAFRSDKISFDAPVGRTQAFEIPLTCPDPRKYNQVVTTGTIPSSGSLSATNSGNTATFMVAELAADATNPYIDSSTAGMRLPLVGAIQAGTTVDFLARKTYLPNGTRAELAAMPRDWVPILPGANTLTSNAVWNIEYRFAWS